MPKRKAARRSAPKAQAVARNLDASTKALSTAISQRNKSGASIKSIGGGIALAIAAIREFCKNWPKVKPVLLKAIAFLKKNSQEKIAAILESLVKFLDTVAKICKYVPGT
jgi:hypothetical protein